VFGLRRRFVIMFSTPFRSFSVYPTVTIAAHESSVTAAPQAGPVTTWIGVRDAKATGRFCVWPPGRVGWC